jgi:hypothetical protein
LIPVNGHTAIRRSVAIINLTATNKTGDIYGVATLITGNDRPQKKVTTKSINSA